LGAPEWGHVSEADALAALHAALDHGVNFIDTADIMVAGGVGVFPAVAM
jgi:aryl-alcohol dehydrogenase-like predicted oxidoreductase